MLRFALFLAALLSVAPAFAQDSAPPPTAAATSTTSPEIHEFQVIDDNWSNSINMRDQYGLELVLSPLFVDIAASGDVTTRNQQIAYLLSGDDKSIHLDQKVITVRMLGDVAVVNGTYTLHHRAGNALVDEKGVFTQVFQRAHGGWMCVNSQRTVLREDSNAKPKKQSNSSAELPFHFPIFSKN